MRRLALFLSLVTLGAALSPGAAHAAPLDAVTARDQLKEGYALKKAGRCAEAVPHLVESERLDPQAKTLLNLAECEDALGHLVDADAHLIEAADRARTEGHPELATIARQRLDVIDKRVPRLTVVVAPGAPPDTQVLRDGTPLRAVSLGVALPLDPGVHTVQATAEGTGSRRFEVTLKESEVQTVTVSPVQTAASSSVSTAPTSGAPSGSSGGPSHVPAIVAFGVGGAGAVVGTIFGIRSFSQWSDAKSECKVACGAGSQSQSSLSGARTSATVSDVGFIAGGVGVAAGVLLLLLTPRGPAADATSPASASGLRSFWLDPQIGRSGGYLSLGERF